MKNNISSNRSFGFVFFVVFLVIAFWSFRGDFNQIKILPILLSLVFLILGLFNSKLLTPLNKLWVKFGDLLGKIIAPIVMAIIFFLLITPIGIILKIFKKDLLNLKFNLEETYWKKRNNGLGSMKRQF